jgi:hypothetical protein
LIDGISVPEYLSRENHLNSQRDHASESNQQKVRALEVDWVAVEDVLLQLTAVIVDDGGWRLFKTGQEDFKGVSWGLVRSHYFKPVANCMEIELSNLKNCDHRHHLQAPLLVNYFPILIEKASDM